MKKEKIRKLTDEIVKINLIKKLGFLFLRIGEYVRRINKEKEWEELKNRLSPIEWLEEEKIEKKYSSHLKKKKIRFFHQQANMWNAISSLYEEFKKDENYDVLVILTGTSYNLCAQINQMKEIGAQYIEAVDYSFTEDRPDILIIYNSWNWESLPKHLWLARKYTKKIIEIPLWTRDNFGSINTAIHKLYWDEIKPDYCLVDKYMYDKYIKSDTKNKYLLFGHPKLDILHKKLNKEKKIPDSWKKLKGKKIMLYATDHGLTLDGVYQDCAFDIYAKNIFEFFRKNTEYGLIFRPHESYINDLLRTFWSATDYNYLKNVIENSPNIIWDETDDFTTAYSIADGLILDLNCDITATAILLNKPVAVLRRNDIKTRAYSPEITDCYTNVFNIEELQYFFQEFREGNDKQKSVRNDNIKNIVYSFEGDNGEKIKKFIEKIS